MIYLEYIHCASHCGCGFLAHKNIFRNPKRVWGGEDFDIVEESLSKSYATDYGVLQIQFSQVLSLLVTLRSFLPLPSSFLLPPSSLLPSPSPLNLSTSQALHLSLKQKYRCPRPLVWTLSLEAMLLVLETALPSMLKQGRGLL